MNENCAACGEFKLHPVHTYQRDPAHHLFEAMPDEMPLFSAPPESSEPYKVKGLGLIGYEERGDWIQCWAEAPRPLHSVQDREAVMRLLFLDPDDFKLYPAAPLTKNLDVWRTWWYCWPKKLTPYSERE